MQSTMLMFFTFCSRATTQTMRQPGVLAKDITIQILTGAFFGFLYTEKKVSKLMLSTYMLGLALGLTTSLASLRVFGNELLVFWREAAPGGGMNLSKIAYFLAKNVIEIPRLMLLTAGLLSTFYSITSPRGSFMDYFYILFAGSWTCAGLAYLVSVVIEPKSAQLATVCIILVLFTSGGMEPGLQAIKATGDVPYALTWLSYVRWTSECIYTTETRQLSDAFKMPPTFYEQPARDSVLLYLYKLSFQEVYLDPSSEQYKIIDTLNLPILVMVGVGLRILAFVCLCTMNRSKMGKRSFFETIAEPALKQLELAVQRFNTWTHKPAARASNKNASMRTTAPKANE